MRKTEIQPLPAEGPKNSLIAWRESMGYSQREAVRALGCARGAYAGWESGEHEIPKYITLACRALALNMGDDDPRDAAQAA